MTRTTKAEKMMLSSLGRSKESVVVARKSKDAGEDEDINAREPEKVIVLRMLILGAMFSVSSAAWGLGGCCWR